MAKKNNPNEIDNKYEVMAIFISFLEKHWWKLAILIVLVGLTITGFTLKCGDNEVVKEQLRLRPSEVKKNE